MIFKSITSRPYELNGEDQSQDPEALRLRVIALGASLIQAVKNGEVFDGWNTAQFAGSDSVLLGRTSCEDSWESVSTLALSSAESFIISLEGDELEVARFSRRPHPAGMETLALHSVVNPRADVHTEKYDEFLTNKLDGISNEQRFSPYTYGIYGVLNDMSSLPQPRDPRTS